MILKSLANLNSAIVAFRVARTVITSVGSVDFVPILYQPMQIALPGNAGISQTWNTNAVKLFHGITSSPTRGYHKEEQMPREKESYRDNLERLMDRFPGKEILSLTEVSQYTGMGYRQLMSSDIPLKRTSKRGNYFISAASLARWLS